MGKCYFSPVWLKNPSYSTWLAQVQNSTHKAFCRWCKKEFDVSNMGECALKSHATSKKHISMETANKNVTSIADSFRKQPTSSLKTSEGATSSTSSSSILSSTSSSSTPSLSTSTSQQPLLDNVVSGDSVLNAEVYHCLNLISKHNSYNSSSDAGDLYRLMFPDSQIASKFSCADKKAAYMTTFGLGPYLKRCQLDAIKRSENYVLLFDESLNHNTQSKQLDTYVRYWLGDSVKSHYYDSNFMGHAKADDLLDSLRSTWESIGNRKGMLEFSL